MKLKYKYLKLYISLLIISIIICGCSNRDSDSNIFIQASTPGIEVVDVPELIQWKYIDKGNKSLLDDEIKNVRVIKLNTPSEEVIGSITKSHIFGDSIVVIDAYKAQKIYLFDKDGNLLNIIGGVGEGPGEYTSINGIYFGKKSIHILDWMSWKYIIYDLEGNIISERKFDRTKPSNLYQLDDSTFIGSYSGYSKQNKFALTWIKNDSVVNTGLPYKWNRPETAGRFFEYDNGNMLLFQHEQSDTIYSLSDSVIKPAFSLGLHKKGEMWSFIENTKDLNTSDYRKALNRFDDQFPQRYSLFRLKDKWLVLHYDHDNAYLSIKDDDKDTARTYNTVSFKDNYSNYTFNFIDAYDNFIIASMDDTLLKLSDKNLSDGINKLPSEYNDLLMNYDYASENPILLILAL